MKNIVLSLDILGFDQIKQQICRLYRDSTDMLPLNQSIPNKSKNLIEINKLAIMGLATEIAIIRKMESNSFYYIVSVQILGGDKLFYSSVANKNCTMLVAVQ